jgi:hypothetical protein
MTKPGLYLINSTGEGVPVLTESGGDTELLKEALENHGFELQEKAEA